MQQELAKLNEMQIANLVGSLHLQVINLSNQVMLLKAELEKNETPVQEPE